MNTPTKPSAGALRAARAFNSIPRGWNKSNPVEELAEIIDRESGLAELLEAAKALQAVAVQCEHFRRGEPYHHLIEAAKTAIAKASNPQCRNRPGVPQGALGRERHGMKGWRDTELTAEDLEYHNAWKPASGHPKGWRVVRGISPLEEHNGKTGRLILFKSMQSAQKRADQLNTP